ncbi:MAG: hypothetical protein AABX52_04325 [Nanoarchaeota archaeon]
MTPKIDNVKTILFPAIAIDIVTGYNTYQKPVIIPKTKFLVSYLHSNLRADDEHHQDLERKVQEYGISTVFSSQCCHRVDRTAIYRLEQGWQAEQYYDIKGNRVQDDKINNLVKQGVPIIGISKQYDLRIGIDDRKSLDCLLEVFRRHANAYIINKRTGNIVMHSKWLKRKRNQKYKIRDAWEIPYITVESKDSLYLQGYESIKKISVEGFDVDINLLIDKKWDEYLVEPKTGLKYPTLRSYFDYTGTKSKISAVSVNKLFADWINTLHWERVKKARSILNPRTFK